MAQEIINIGAAANDGTGDPLRTAFDKVNNNFTQLYTTLSASGPDGAIQFKNTNTLYSTLYVGSTYLIAGAPGRVYYSNDGAVWFPATTGTEAAIYSLAYDGIDTIIAVGANGTILRSTDGGVTWASSTSGVTENLYGAVGFNGSLAVVGANGTILTSHVGGEGYTVVPTVTIAAPTNAGGITATATATIANGRVSGFTITEPGLGYETAPTVTIADPNTAGLTATATAEIGGGIVTAINLSSGINWGRPVTGITNTLTGITHGNLNISAVVTPIYVATGVTGTIVTSTDLVTWSSVTTGTTQDLYSAVIDPLISKLIVVGESGTVLTTFNASLWTTEISNVSTTLTSIAFGVVNTITDLIAVGNTGTVIRSNNGGVNWYSAASNTTSNPLLGVTFISNTANINSSSFLAVGSNATVIDSNVLSLANTWSLQSVGSALQGDANLLYFPGTQTLSANANIVPGTDSAFSLGTPNLKFTDLYLSGNSLYLGNTVITSNANNSITFAQASNTANLTTLYGNNITVQTANVYGNANIGGYVLANNITTYNFNGSNANIPNLVSNIANANIINANTANIGNLTSANANITALTGGNANLTGNVTANYYFGDGRFLTGLGGGADIGNVTFDDYIVQGRSGYGLGLSPTPDDTANSKYLKVRAGDVDTHIHFDTGNNAFYDQYIGDDNKYVKLEAGDAGNVEIGTYQDGGIGQSIWAFASDGSLHFPNDANIAIIGNITQFNTCANGFLGLNSYDAGGNNIAALNLSSIDGLVGISTYDPATDSDYHWAFNNNGNLSVPGGILGSGNLKLSPDSSNAASYLDIFLTSGPDLHLVASSGANLILGKDDGANIMTSWNGNAYVQSWNLNTGNVGGIWTFSGDGSTIFPTLTVDLHNGGNQSAQTLQFGDPNQQAIITGPTPEANTSAQRLIIQGQRANGTYSEGGDVYVWGGDSDYNGGDIKIYAGDSDGATGGGGYINLAGGDGADTGGYINIDGGYGSNGSGGYVNINGGSGGNGIGGNIQIQGGQSGGTGINGANVLLQGGYSQSANGGAVTVRGGQSALGLSGYGNVLVEAGASTWTFDNTGVLTVPQNIQGGGALNLQGIANGNTTINIGSGVGGDIDMVSNLGNINLYTASNQPWIFDQGGNLTAPGAINVGNMSIGQLPGYITANANTGIILNVSGTDGGFVVDYLGEDGNANTSGGELALNSELGNTTYRISLSDDFGNGFATKIWRFDGTGNLTLPGNIDMSGKWVGNIGYAVLDTDAASKLYVDTMVSSGISYHQPVNAATTTTLATATSGTTAYNEPNGSGNGIGAYISTTGTFATIDGVTINSNTSIRILVKDEANAAWNGVYNYTNATAITRSSDADEYGPDSVEQLSINDYFFTQAGTVNKGTGFVVSAPAGTITFGTSNITFSTFSTSQVYTAGTGIDISGTVISANASQTQITAVGTLGTLDVSGNANTGNLGTTTAIITTGNITTINTGLVQNGNSNVAITANANITLTAKSNATVVISDTGANITGTGNFSGNLSAANLIGPHANGNSNVNIPAANGNVNISAAGNANVLVITGTGANITGTINANGNANVGNLGTTTAIISTGNITTINSGLLQNGNSNVTITANANVTITSKSNAIMVITDTGANITGTANVSGNANVGNLGTATAIITTGNITTVNTGLVQNGTSNVTITANANVTITSNSNATMVISDTGVNVTGNITATAATATASSTAASVGYLGMPQQSKSSAYTTVIGDAGKHIYVTATATMTIDSNANVAYPIGTAIVFISSAGTATTIAINSDTMYLAGTGTTGSRTLAAYGMATAIKVNTTVWFISGIGLT